jgi:hypothetical protein
MGAVSDASGRHAKERTMDGDVEYDRFNARDIDDVLAVLVADVAWANAMDGGHVYEAVREYWTRQWTMVSPHVEPASVHRTADGAIIAEVRQSVRDLDGKPLQGQTLGLKDKTVGHVSVFERARWLASTSRMPPRRRLTSQSLVSQEDEAQPSVPQVSPCSSGTGTAPKIAGRPYERRADLEWPSPPAEGPRDERGPAICKT